MLTALLLIPLLGAIHLSFINKNWPGYDLRIRRSALIWVTLAWIYSAILWIGFDCNDTGWQYIGHWPSMAGIGSVRVGVDGIGLTFIILTTYLMPVAILSTWDNVQHGIRSHLIFLLILESMLISVFTTLDIIAFYVSFESVLIPLYLLVGYHGASNARLRASMLLFLYTLGGSLAMLLGLIRLVQLGGTSDMMTLSTVPFDIESQKWIWICIFISLAIKAPLVPFHIWLPRAHSEAPLSTSIVLAGLILKLSTYGYIRLLLALLPDACVYFSPLVLCLSVITIIHGAIVTLRQVDSKTFIAISSVSHMGLVMLGLGSATLHGLQGAMLLSVAHGLISPALFILFGGVLYDRYHTRIIRYFRGLGAAMPSFKTWFFLASCCSMGVPGSLNWVSELFCLLGSYEVSPIAAVLGSTSVVLGAAYTTWLYMLVTGGEMSPSLALSNDLTRRERTMLAFLVIPTFILGLLPSLLLDHLHVSLSLLTL